jgi:hypothetical protein
MGLLVVVFLAVALSTATIAAGTCGGQEEGLVEITAPSGTTFNLNGTLTLTLENPLSPGIGVEITGEHLVPAENFNFVNSCLGWLEGGAHCTQKIKCIKKGEGKYTVTAGGGAGLTSWIYFKCD